MKSKTFLLKLGLISLAIIPITSIISCGSSKEPTINPNDKFNKNRSFAWKESNAIQVSILGFKLPINEDEYLFEYSYSSELSDANSVIFNPTNFSINDNLINFQIETKYDIAKIQSLKISIKNESKFIMLKVDDNPTYLPSFTNTDPKFENSGNWVIATIYGNNLSSNKNDYKINQNWVVESASSTEVKITAKYELVYGKNNIEMTNTTSGPKITIKKQFNSPMLEATSAIGTLDIEGNVFINVKGSYLSSNKKDYSFVHTIPGFSPTPFNDFVVDTWISSSETVIKVEKDKVGSMITFPDWYYINGAQLQIKK